MTDYDRKLHAALEQIRERLNLLTDRTWKASEHGRFPPPLQPLPPFPNSGPSSADAPDGGPPPAVAASPAGANFQQRLELVERYIGPSALAWMRGQRWHCPLDCECRAVADSGTPGTAAAKESSDTTAAAPVGAAMKGECDSCGAIAALHRAPLRDGNSHKRLCLDCMMRVADAVAPADPESHACHPGERDCNCDQALELEDKLKECRRLLRFAHQRAAEIAQALDEIP